jgi:hypothetical protein
MDNAYSAISCVLVLTAWSTSTQRFKANVTWPNGGLFNRWPRYPAHRNKPVLPFMRRSNRTLEHKPYCSAEFLRDLFNWSTA